MGRKSDALIYTNCAAEFLLQFHLGTINCLDLSSDRLPKVYVGILILLDNYEHLRVDDPLKQQLLEKITLPALHYTYNTFIKADQLDDLLKGTGYICGGKRIIKI